VKKICFYASLFVLFFSLSGCGKDSETGTINLNIKLKYGASDLIMLNKYDYPLYGYPITYNRFSLFMSEITVNGTDGNRQVEDIAYVDLSNAHSTKELASKGYDLSIKDVPVGSYSGMTFAIGVPPLSNSKTPASFKEKPLSDQAEYWGDWQSYIFSRTEGQMDKDKDGKYESTFSLHTGSNAAFRTLRLSKPIVISTNGITTINLEIDLAKQFSGSKVYDINANPQIHSNTQGAQVAELIDNLIKAFSIK
jgi:hypothetical protein